MSFSSWLRKGKRSGPAACRRTRMSRGRRASFRPRLEALEERWLPTLPYPTAATTSQLAADINYADTTGGAFTINLQPSTTFALTSGPLAVGGANPVDLTILGNGDTIDGSQQFRLFNVGRASLTLDHVTLHGGYVFEANGGGIYNAFGTVRLSNSTVSGNYAEDGNGGGIYNYFGTVIVQNSSHITGNSSNIGDVFVFDVDNHGVLYLDSTSTIYSLSGNTAIPLTTPQFLGDYNLNHVVDAADYVLWRKTLGTVGISAFSGADGSGSATVDAADYNVWRGNFGATSAAVGGLDMGGTATDGALVAATSIEQSSPVAPPTTKTESAEAPLPSTNLGLLESQMAAQAVDLSFALDSGIGNDTTHAAMSQARAMAGGPQLTATVVDQLLLLCPTGTEERMLAAVDAHFKFSANKSSADLVHFGSVVDAIFEELVPGSTDPVCS
jgi:hypothetical protein